MGIEENIERIAIALGTIAEVQSRMLSIAEWNKNRLENVATPTEASVPAEPEQSHDDLKTALLKRGVEVPKGTKMTTLYKLWAEYKDAPVLPAEPATVAETPVAKTPVAKTPSDADIFGDSAPVKEETKKPLTLEEARELLLGKYKNTPEDKGLMIAALAKFGATRFTEVKPGDYDKLVAAFLELKGETK